MLQIDIFRNLAVQTATKLEFAKFSQLELIKFNCKQLTKQ